MIINKVYLEEAREDAVLTKSQMSELAKISPATYTKILNGEEVGPKTATKLIKAFKLDKDRLLNSTK